MAKKTNDRIFPLADFQQQLRKTEEEVNLMLIARFNRGRLAYVIDDLEFRMPVRQKLVGGQIRQYVVLSGDLQADDFSQVFRLRKLAGLPDKDPEGAAAS